LHAATTLTTLTQNLPAIKAAASCFITLVIKESDNNVKLIVLDDRLHTLCSKHGHVLDGPIVDLLQILYMRKLSSFPFSQTNLFRSTDMGFRRKEISIALSMTSSRNMEKVALFLKKQLQKT